MKAIYPLKQFRVWFFEDEKDHNMITFFDEILARPYPLQEI